MTESTDIVRRDDVQSLILREVAKLQEQLVAWRGKAHLLTPMARTSVDIVAPGFVPSIRTRQIDPDPNHDDVYLLPNKELALHKTALEDLDHLAGINWLYSRRIDNRSDPRYAEYECSGEVQDIDGTWRNATATGVYDLNDGAPQAEKIRKGQSEAALANCRVHIAAQAETKAKNRVRREILGLPGSFTVEELKLPFVVLRMVPDPNDPQMREIIMRRGTGARDVLFPRSNPPTPIAPPGGTTGLELPEPPGCAPPQTTQPQTALPPAPQVAVPQAPVDPRAKLIADVEALYRAKVAGGKRDPNKPPLTVLTNEQLQAMIEHMAKWPDQPNKPQVPDI